MQSKVILIFTLILIIFPAIFFFFADFAALPIEDRLQAAIFQSVTTRTAGFNTVNLSAMSGSSQGIMILLMLIGGSPGSTAGGMKTTTFAVQHATIFLIAESIATLSKLPQLSSPCILRCFSAEEFLSAPMRTCHCHPAYMKQHQHWEQSD